VKSREYAGLHVLVDDDPRWPRDPVEQASAALSGGAPVIQLRTKHAGDRQTLDWALAIRQLTLDHGARFVVNDRFDLALASEADAVHLGQDDLPPSSLPENTRHKLAVGRSTHNLEQLRAAMDEAVDYVAFGPVYGTQSAETGYSARGIKSLAAVARLARAYPVIAIGGIRAKHLAELVAAGVAGVAVISAVAGSEEPEAATRRLVDDPAWRDLRGMQ
jgi:thiamine-phosphate pyrophosphorylase